MKKTLLYTFLIFVLVGLIFTFKPSPKTLTTDSGWDTSYDSSSSSSSYDSDSSNSSFNYYSDADDETSDDGVIITLIILFIILSITIRIICIGLSEESASNIDNNDYDFEDCSDDQFNKIGIKDIPALKEELFKIFVDIQNAWMEFDYDSLSKLCSDELYNSYKSDLEILKIKNGKNIMKNFTNKKMKIYDIKVDNSNKKDKITLYVYLYTSFYDYVINTDTEDIIRGTDERKVFNNYKLEYTKINKTINKCPSCGAKIKNTSNQKCSHCENIIVNNNSNYILSHKERI